MLIGDAVAHRVCSTACQACTNTSFFTNHIIFEIVEISQTIFYTDT